MKPFTIAPLVGATGLSLLLGGPALASGFSIDLNKTFGDAYTGVTARYDFLFGGGPGAYTLDLTINNTSTPPPAPTLQNPNPDGVTSSSLTGFAFDTPTGVTGLTYNRNGTNFYQASDLTIPPANAFNFCASTDNNPNNGTQCGAGSVNLGLANGQSALVKFTFNSTAADTNAVATAFQSLYNSVQYESDGSAVNDTVVLAARFQEVNSTYNGTTFTGDSDKVTGGGGGQGPGDAVPGPLPLLGAAAAFGYSRKLRNRLKSNAVLN